MSAAEQVFARINRLPNAVKIGLGAVVAVVAFIIVNDYVWAQSREWDDEADRLQAIISDSRRLSGDAGRELTQQVILFGPTEVPGEASTGSTTLIDTVNAIIKGHGSDVTNYSFTGSAGSKLPRDVLQSVAPGQRFELLKAEVKFDTSTKVLAQILHELESSPVIEGISSMRVVRYDVRPKVSVQLTVESWVRSGAAGPRRGGPAA